MLAWRGCRRDRGPGGPMEERQLRWEVVGLQRQVDQIDRHWLRILRLVVQRAWDTEDTGSGGGDGSIGEDSVGDQQVLEALCVWEPLLRGERLAADPIDVETTPRAHDGARVWKPYCLRKQQDRLQRLGLGVIVLWVARLDINVHPDRLQGQRSGTRLGSAPRTVRIGLVV